MKTNRRPLRFSVPSLLRFFEPKIARLDVFFDGLKTHEERVTWFLQRTDRKRFSASYSMNEFRATHGYVQKLMDGGWFFLKHRKQILEREALRRVFEKAFKKEMSALRSILLEDDDVG